MSNNTPSQLTRHVANASTLFAALGDPTRLALVTRLSNGSRQSIAQLTAGHQVTRQAISKHLHVLEKARVVNLHRVGRESLYALNPESMHDARRYIERVSRQWDDALSRLKNFVEE